MAKKNAPKRKKIEKLPGIDHIPNWWKQPRSARGPTRRTDFSLLCFSSSSLSNGPLGKGLLLGSSSSKDKPRSDTITELEERRDKRDEVLEFSAVKCRKFEDLRLELFSDLTEVPMIEVESVSQNTLFEAWSGRTADKQESDMVRKLEFTPDKSQITESSNFCITPGSVLCDKTTHRLWSAEALNKRECKSFAKEFTESSDNPNCSIQRDDNPNRSIQRDQSPDKWNSSSSSRAESDCVERRRGTRERKRKVHFDEVIFPLKSMRKGRRFRIMRFLGLAAPVGSPFH